MSCYVSLRRRLTYATRFLAGWGAPSATRKEMGTCQLVGVSRVGSAVVEPSLSASGRKPPPTPHHPPATLLGSATDRYEELIRGTGSRQVKPLEKSCEELIRASDTSGVGCNLHLIMNDVM